MNVRILLCILVLFMTLQYTISKLHNQEGKRTAQLCTNCATFHALNKELMKENYALTKKIEQLKKFENCEPRVMPYKSLGCFKDSSNRAIPPLEGYDPLLDGGYQSRQNAIQKCYQAALKRGYKVFAVQDGGWCASSPTAEQTYNKYGGSNACAADGEGGPWGNQVYEIKEPKVMPYKSLGCFKDTRDRAIPTLEGEDPLLDGAYKSRQNAIQKCYQAALKRGYKVFAVQDGGWCASSPTAEQTYNKYGGSNACAADGEGGGLGNQVYEIEGE